ncbi:MAG: hypothetical protein JJU02_13000 [Cryomorphaceae bacterium]|nr:hypothetical protein [Cryomorphaceae bacterium]
MRHPLENNDNPTEMVTQQTQKSMNEEVVIGDFNIIHESIPAEGNVFIRLKPIDMISYWKRCGMLADFVAAFYGNTREKSQVLENSISTIFNELIENATKYSVKRGGEVKIHLMLYDSILKIEIENITTINHYEGYKKHVKNLLECEDLEGLYYQTLAEKSDSPEGSGIGIMLLLKDYPIKIGARFHSEDGTHRVKIQVYYSLESA